MAKKHPNKHIRDAIKYACENGWRITASTGHYWGHLLCPLETREGCMLGVFSTPRNPENHAKWLRKMIDRCPHGGEPTSGEPSGDEPTSDEHTEIASDEP